jgi:hypothetical protein
MLFCRPINFMQKFISAMTTSLKKQIAGLYVHHKRISIAFRANFGLVAL